jgi:G3E family GTPase
MPQPVTVITGFLGSGKSTLLNRILAAPEMADTAVIINEFGEVSIDHLLVETSLEDALVLQNGCICCTIRGDLVDTLMGLEARVARGELPPFRRVVIETTGLADAAPILQTLLFDPLLAGRYEVATVVTTVDAVHIADQLSTFPEASRQIAFANVVTLTKTDLADTGRVAMAAEDVRRLNPAARIATVLHGDIDFELFAPAAPPDEARLRSWLAADAYEPAAREQHDHSHDGHDHDHPHGASRHAAEIRSFCATFEEPLDLGRFKRWLLSIVSLKGRQLLRVKGVVNIDGIARPVVIQGVQHTLYPPLLLRAWPDGDRRSRIVFITHGLTAGALESTLPYLAASAR